VYGLGEVPICSERLLGGDLAYSDRVVVECGSEARRKRGESLTAARSARRKSA